MKDFIQYITSLGLTSSKSINNLSNIVKESIQIKKKIPNIIKSQEMLPEILFKYFSKINSKTLKIICKNISSNLNSVLFNAV